MENLEQLAQIASRLAVKAGAEIMTVRSGGFDVETKGDGSPVTVADRRAERIILGGLDAAGNTVPVVAEEQMSGGHAPDISGGTFLCIDPLDGTKEFARGGEDFTVNIALVKNKAPVFGVIFIPATRALYVGFQADGNQTAYRAIVDAAGKTVDQHAIACRTAPEHPAIVASRSHLNAETEQFLARYPGSDTVSVGSSLKFCRVAEGKADLYPRFGPTMEWDTAAGDAILRAAGGMTFGPDGHPFEYTKPDFRNGHFMAAGTVKADAGWWA